MKFLNRKKLGAFSLIELMIVLAVIALLAAFTLPAGAQLNSAPGISSIEYARTYWLTNTTTFTLTTGGTNMAGSASTTINSVPFPLKKGRGFGLYAEFIGTNASTAAITLNMQFATPVTNGTALVTNWNTYGLIGVPFLMNGTTRVYAFTNVPASVADNAQLCRLGTVANAHTAGCAISPTNTYVVIEP